MFAFLPSLFSTVHGWKQCLRFGSAPILLALAACLLAGCDRGGTGKAAGMPKRASLPVEPRFRAAREQLLAGEYPQAAAALEQLRAEGTASQPLLNWIALYDGLALLLSGRDADARGLFAELESRGLYSQAPDQMKLPGFFVQVAKLLRTEEPISPDVAKDYDKFSYEAFALLLFALKDWNLEKTEDAITLFRQFRSARPDAPELWLGGPEEIRRLQAIAANIVDDFAGMRLAENALSTAGVPEEKAEALKVAKHALSEMKSPKLIAALKTRIDEIEPANTLALEGKARMAADALGSDAKALPEAKQKRSALLAQFRFEEARAAIAEASLHTEPARAEQETLTKQTQWLANFKSRLIDDLNGGGYAKPIKLKNGAPAAGLVAKADEQNLQLRVERKLVPVPWSEVSFESALEMAKSFLSPDAPPLLAATRKWQLGVFTAFLGKPEEARPLLDEAAEVMDIFKEEIPVALSIANKSL